MTENQLKCLKYDHRKGKRPFKPLSSLFSAFSNLKGSDLYKLFFIFRELPCWGVPLACEGRGGSQSQSHNITCHDPLDLWAIPPARLGLSGRNSGKFRKDPGNALRAFPGIPLASTAGIPQALQFKAFEGSRAFPEFSPPQYG